jgi:hypothetical protein
MDFDALQRLTDPELLATARRLALQGAHGDAARAFEEGGRRMLGRFEVPDAVAALTAAARLRALNGEVAEAEALLLDVETLAARAGRGADWARARAELADQRGEPALRRERWRLARDLAEGDVGAQIHALGRLADEARERQALDEAAAHLSAAAELARQGEPARRAEVLIELAVVRTAAGKPRSAEAALVEAVALADGADSLLVRVEGQRAVIALSEGRVPDALAWARAASARARGAGHVQGLLAAGQIEVLALQHQGDEPGAYAALRRVEADLVAALGEDGAALLAPAIALFQERLGAERAEALHAAWAAGR